jgi:pSer/pThr/pTyr-binding forkhead associated (FHA) protein
VNDETVIIPSGAPTFAYLFWVRGPRRGEHAMLRADGVTIGRGPRADIILDDPAVSVEHARIRVEDGTWYLYDLASSNRTKVAGEVVHRHALADADRLTVGETDLVFRRIG